MALITDQLVKVIKNPNDVNPYLSVEDQIIKAMTVAYDDGYAKGRQEVLDAIKDFDDSKDPLQS